MRCCTSEQNVGASLSTWASSSDIGPIAAPATATVHDGDIAVVFGGRFDNVLTQTTLSGDNLTWTAQALNNTNLGNDAATVIQTGLNSSGSDQTVTAKTITTSGATGAGAGRMFIIEQPPITTLATGSDPGANTIAPGAAATDVNQFILQADSGTETITDVTVNLSTNSGIGLLAITDNANTVLGSTASPATGSNIIAVSGMSAIDSSPTTFKVRATPLPHSAMDPPPGGSYDITAPVTAWTGTGSYTHTGGDTNSNALTIDNLSPDGATSTSGSAGDKNVTLNWTTSSSGDFNITSGSVIYRWQSGSAGSETPDEGSAPSIGGTDGTATVACVVSSSGSTALERIDGSGGSAECTTADLTNNLQYTYVVFQKDNYGNYDAGVLIGTFTPASFSAAIEIRAQDYSTPVSTITFPAGAPGATVSNPSNSESETQTFGIAGVAKPVVTLYNGGASTLIIWYNITTFAPNNVVSSEYYLINNSGAACADETAINSPATFDADTVSAGSTTIAAAAAKDLYLKVILSNALAGKSGASTLTILGEAS